jgi:glycosyltransferase involved in cell wall biosynthesis
MKKPAVTVCIATRNQGAFIEQCVRSVLEQEAYAQLHILVGDDASDDGTSDIVARLATQHPGMVEHLFRNTNLGAFANMRDLIARATGDFVARVDGDDYWLPGKLQRQLDYFQAHPDCAAVYTNAITVDESGNRLGLFNNVGDARFDLAELLRRGNFLNNSSVLFRAAGRHAWLDVDVPQIDYRAHLWHARHGWLGHIGEALTAYRVNTGGALTSTQASNDVVRELYWEAIMSVPRGMVADDDIGHGIADFLRRVLSRTVRTGRWELARKWFPRGFEASPYGGLRTSLLVMSSAIRQTRLSVTEKIRRMFIGRAAMPPIRHHR